MMVTQLTLNLFPLVLEELNPQSRPFEISQRWGAKSGDTHRFIFKRPTDDVEV